MTYILRKYETEYHLFSSKRADIAQYSIADNKLEQVGKMSDTMFPWIEGRPRVIASTLQKPGLARIDMADLKILLGEADIKVMAAQWALKNADETMGSNSALNRGFIAGYNKCLQVNADKKYTADDMARLVRWLSTTGKFLHAPTGNLSGNKLIIDEFIRQQGYSKKGEWKVELEMEFCPQALPQDRYVPLVTNGQVNIIKIITE